ncbi:symmetrical bis(5'-nucleosyl)-tetraphosphatase [Wenzhouxiangella marina]|uniref:bis(5'-nucleosyl)-tetraphosphatase (symmetrical) n=1 Tax=Wenzhouxiangella marina TaxID=1579979 RepID=A0A0K0XSY1_9GAMM|nr:symmetrical bis(5'-nucleosyl)-tetraphosphatase [Wenzhouxiangella marina]AKS40726.1 Bis(5'-nucleosyl)-tetraphosphatase, symmetrical [Wenzhouxiangella marina]MBB6087599.1 bis(5'-nucleosyl)-tetraphosphatase (symmetrical) [Wenzhouxiangella marina]
MKRQIFIGDVQGCAGPLERLLDRLDFDPARDRLRFAGDLVNRGGDSLATLRLIRSLGKSAMSVLGNHDLHLLAYAHHHPRVRKHNKEFEAIMAAEDGPELLAWLARQPMFWKHDRRRLALVHAGVDPRWGPEATARRAAEVEHALKRDPERFFAHMYGDRPRRWKPGRSPLANLRCITNVMTRMRFCDPKGRLNFGAKGSIKQAPKGCRPWFDFLHRDWQGWTLVFGHWSMLGLFQNEQVIGLDSGCVWGGALTALVIDDEVPVSERRLVSIGCGC